MELKSIVLILSFLIFFSPVAVAAQATITIKQGWNMVASPVEEGVSLSMLLSSCNKLDKFGNEYLWGWDAASQSWTHPQTLPAYSGAWIYSNGDCDIAVTGTMVSQSPTINLKGGWNLVSFDGSLADFIGTCAGKMTHPDYGEKAVRMDASLQSWTNTVVLDSSKSYWVWVSNDCRLGGVVTNERDLEIVGAEYPKAVRTSNTPYYFEVLGGKHDSPPTDAFFYGNPPNITAKIKLTGPTITKPYNVVLYGVIEARLPIIWTGDLGSPEQYFVIDKKEVSSHGSGEIKNIVLSPRNFIQEWYGSATTYFLVKVEGVEENNYRNNRYEVRIGRAVCSCHAPLPLFGHKCNSACNNAGADCGGGITVDHAQCY